MFSLFHRKKRIRVAVDQRSLEMKGYQYISNFREEMINLISKHEFSKSAGEMLPPWFVCLYPKSIPGIERLGAKSSLWRNDYWYWRGGDGGSYWAGFLIFFINLNYEQKIEYFKRYDLGELWKERVSWFFTLFDEEIIEGLTKAQVKAATIEVLGEE
jgi:hypothetical protein